MGLNTPPQSPRRNIVDWVYYTPPFNLTGQLAASIPSGWIHAGLPMGMQMVAISHREIGVLPHNGGV